MASGTTETQGFGYDEHLLVWAWRRIATQPDACAATAHEFAASCGEDAAEVFATLSAFMSAIDTATRRKLVLGTPGSHTITPDERRILTLIAAAQAPAPAVLEAHLHWLALPEQRDLLSMATDALAAALTANSLRLAAPEPHSPGICERPLAVA